MGIEIIDYFLMWLFCLFSCAEVDQPMGCVKQKEREKRSAAIRSSLVGIYYSPARFILSELNPLHLIGAHSKNHVIKIMTGV